MFDFVVSPRQNGQTCARLVDDCVDFFIDFAPNNAAPFDYKWQATITVAEGHDVGVNGRGATWEYLPYEG